MLYPEGDRPDDNIKFNETSVFTTILESITKDKKYTCESASDMKYNYFLEEYLVAQRNILTL